MNEQTRMNKSEDHVRLQLKTNRIYLISLSNSDRLNVRKRRVNLPSRFADADLYSEVDRYSLIHGRFFIDGFLVFRFVFVGDFS